MVKVSWKVSCMFELLFLGNNFVDNVRAQINAKYFFFILWRCVGAQTGPRPPTLTFLDHTQLDTHAHTVGFI